MKSGCFAAFGLLAATALAAQPLPWETWRAATRARMALKEDHWHPAADDKMRDVERLES